MTQPLRTPRRGLNGVDLDLLADAVDAVREEPALAEFEFRAENLWQEGGHNRTTVDEYRGARQEHTRAKPFVLDADEPPLLLGEDRAAHPVEHLLHALAACLTTSVVYRATARGIAVRSVRSSLSGEIDLQGFLALDPDPAQRCGCRRIRVRIEIDADADADELRELCALGARCSPLVDVVSNGVPVAIEVAEPGAGAGRR